MKDVAGVHWKALICAILVVLFLGAGVGLTFGQESETTYVYDVTVEQVTVQDTSSVVAYDSLDSFEQRAITKSIQSDGGIGDGIENTIETHTDHGDRETIQTVSVDGMIVLVSIDYSGSSTHPESGGLAFIGILLIIMSAISFFGVLEIQGEYTDD